MRRYTDTFFRTWKIAILPIFLLPLGAFVLLRPPITTYGVANIWADQASLQQLTYADPGLSPAQNVANYLNQLLMSPSFDVSVAKQSPLYWHSIPVGIDPKNAVQSDLSRNAQATTGGPNLVTIAYSTKRLDVAAQVVQGILSEASVEIRTFNRQQASRDSATYELQYKRARANYAAAAKSLRSYMLSQNIASDQLILAQLSDAKLAELYQAVQSGQADATNAQQQLSKVRAQQNAQVSFRVIDPAAAKVLTRSKRQQLTSLIIPFILGLLVSGGFIAGRTAFDRTVRFAGEVPDLLGLPVLAAIPHSLELAGAKRRGRRFRNATSTGIGEG